MRQTDAELHPKAVERHEEARKEKAGALLRFVGAIVLGMIGSWKLVAPDLMPSIAPPDGPTTWMWVAVLFLAFGLGTFDQIAKLMPKR